MGKPGKREKYISKGIVGSPAKTPLKGREKIMARLNRWYAEKPTKIKVPSEDNPSIMIKVEAKSIWGSPKTKHKVEVTQEEEI